ncbi:MAG: hypothetical protein H7Y32_13190 [Chloroflexales bacterium]|nr:hypothetical protein [Chloroflexales bacterium]
MLQEGPLANGLRLTDQRLAAPPLLFGPYGSAALDVDQLTTHGANACWFHMFDAAAFEACDRHGVAACVEFKTFRADFAANPELIPIGVDGKPIRYGPLVQGVCLSQTAFLEQTEASLRVGVRQFQPAGIWLDYLTYAGWFEEPNPDLQESCFCPGCIAAFCTQTGIDAPTPAEILAQHAARWAQHKCERVAAFAAHYAQIIRAALPGCVIGAYMCPWTPEEFNGALTRIFAQDYARLAPAIDVFTPLIYGTKSGRPVSWGRTFLEAAPAFVPRDRRVQLILDALDGPDSLVETANSTVTSWGLQVFGGAAVFADPAIARVFATTVERIRAAVQLQDHAA